MKQIPSSLAWDNINWKHISILDPAQHADEGQYYIECGVQWHAADHYSEWILHVCASRIVSRCAMVALVCVFV